MKRITMPKLRHIEFGESKFKVDTPLKSFHVGDAILNGTLGSHPSSLLRKGLASDDINEPEEIKNYGVNSDEVVDTPPPTESE